MLKKDIVVGFINAFPFRYMQPVHIFFPISFCLLDDYIEGMTDITTSISQYMFFNVS